MSGLFNGHQKQCVLDVDLPLVDDRFFFVLLVNSESDVPHWLTSRTAMLCILSSCLAPRLNWSDMNGRRKYRSGLELDQETKKTCSDDCQSKLCPAPEICRKSHVVYLATCDLCVKRYVGMRVRQLHAQAVEHLRVANQRQAHTAYGVHYQTGHKEKDKPKLSFKIISQNHDDLHIEEALAIKTLKPDLNKGQEEMETGLLP